MHDPVPIRSRKSALPDAFLERLRRIVPPESYDAVLRTFAEPPATGFRVNTLRAATEAVEEELETLGLRLHRVAWNADAFWIAPDERPRLLASDAFAEHRIYVQNLASMIPPLVLDAQPGERILDLGAAPRQQDPPTRLPDAQHRRDRRRRTRQAPVS